MEKVCLARRVYPESIYKKLRIQSQEDINSQIPDLISQTVWSDASGRRVVLNVKFLSDGNDVKEQSEKVKKAVNEKIVPILNVRFNFLTASDPKYAHIRISFVRNQGSWSIIGKESINRFDEEVPTMNLSWLSSGNILHQFAHALGFSHENKYTSSVIPWNRQIIESVFSGPPHYWNKTEVQRNFFDVFNIDQFLSGSFDQSSLMKNIFPCSFYTILSCTETTLLDDYSKDDIIAFQKYYPFASTNEIEPAITKITFDREPEWSDLTNLQDLAPLRNETDYYVISGSRDSKKNDWIVGVILVFGVLLLTTVASILVLKFKLKCI